MGIEAPTANPIFLAPDADELAMGSAINKATGGAATPYFRSDGSYVVVDDSTNIIIQVSNRLKPFVPDPTITTPYIPPTVKK